MLPSFVLLSVLAAGDGKLHLTFFDVGHGDATLLVSPVGRTVLIDAGPATAAEHLRLRVPLLTTGELDLVVLTNAGDEHLGALADLVDDLGARRFLDPGVREAGPAHTALIKRLQEKGVQIVLPVPDPESPGELLRIDVGGGVEVQVLWPRAPVEALLASPKKVAANSVVLRAVYGETSVLLMGDAQPETEEYLLKRHFPLQSTLLKVSEHGAGTSSTLPFLVGARPLAGIISVGAGNALGAPAHAVLQRLAQVGAHVFRTDLDGEVDAVSDGKHFTVTTEKLPAGETSGGHFSFPLAPAEGTWAPAATVARAGIVLRLDDAPKRPRKPAGKKAPHAVAVADAPAGAKPEVKTTTPAGDDGVIAVLVAKKGEKVFHFADCPAARKIPTDQMVVFTSRTEASKKFKPAADCQP